MNNSGKRFIIVDDDPLNNLLSKIGLKKSLNDVEVIEFLVPEQALEYIQSEDNFLLQRERTTIFLDINMPSLTGWDFIDKFELFPMRIKDHFEIYILSSSVDPSDITRAKENPLVIDIIEKPLKKDNILRLFG